MNVGVMPSDFAQLLYDAEWNNPRSEASSVGGALSAIINCCSYWFFVNCKALFKY